MIIFARMPHCSVSLSQKIETRMNILELPNEMLLSVMKYNFALTNRECMKLNRRLEKIVRSKDLHKEKLYQLVISKSWMRPDWYEVEWKTQDRAYPGESRRIRWAQEEDLVHNVTDLLNSLRHIDELWLTGFGIPDELFDLLRRETSLRMNPSLKIDTCTFSSEILNSFIESVKPRDFTITLPEGLDVSVNAALAVTDFISLKVYSAKPQNLVHFNDEFLTKWFTSNKEIGFDGLVTSFTLDTIGNIYKIYGSNNEPIFWKFGILNGVTPEMIEKFFKKIGMEEDYHHDTGCRVYSSQCEQSIIIGCRV